MSAPPKADIGVETVTGALTLEPQQARDSAYPFKVSFKAAVKQQATSRVKFTDEASGQSVTKEIFLDYKQPATSASEGNGGSADSEDVVSNKAFVKSVQQYLISKLQPAPTLVVTGDLNEQTRDALERYQKPKPELSGELRSLGDQTANALGLDIIKSAQAKEAIFPGDIEKAAPEEICKAERRLKEEYTDANAVTVDGVLTEYERGLVLQFQIFKENTAPGSFSYLTATLNPATLGYLNIASVKEGCPSS